MTEPVIVNGRNYEKDEIIRLVTQTGKDIKGDLVDLNDPRQFNPSTKDIQRLCKNARKMNNAGKAFSVKSSDL